MSNVEFTVLPKEKIFGKDKLSIFYKGAYETKMTDFALLLGGRFETVWWTSSFDNYICMHVCTNNGPTTFTFRSRLPGIRPCFDYSKIPQINEYYDENNILTIKYGEYPQDITAEETALKLEDLFIDNKLESIGRFTTDAVSNECWEIGFRERHFDEYEYEGKKYIRFVSDYITFQDDLFNKKINMFESNKAYWIEVKPIEWYVDSETNIAISKNVLVSGIQYYGFSKKIFVNDFLNIYFGKEINMEKYNIVDENNSLIHYLNWSKENNIFPLIDLFLIEKNGKYLNYDWKTISNYLCEYRDIYSIESLLDEEVYLDFLEFCNIGVSEEDILSRRVDIKSISKSRKYILCFVMLLNNNIEIDVIRNFMGELGKQYLDYFDSIYEKHFTNNGIKSL